MRSGRNIISISVALGLTAWLIDAVFDFFLYYKDRSFIDLLVLNVPPHETYIRSVVFGIFIFFGVYASRIIERRIRAEEELMRHRERLEEVVTERTSELISANKRLLKEVDERKSAEGSLRESKKQLRHLSSRILTAQEDERKRISRELHDELGQALSLLKLQMRTVERSLSDDQPETRAECENALRYTDEIIENVRRLSRDLRPSVLEDLGLSASLRWLLDNFAKNHGIAVSSDIGDLDKLFSEDEQIIIYRIFQEALNNVGKHAGARNISVVAMSHYGKVVFVLEDDGKGFDATCVAAKDVTERGLGLATMDERVRMLGGVLNIRSCPGGGTRISISIPLKEIREKENVYGPVSHSAGR